MKKLIILGALLLPLGLAAQVSNPSIVMVSGAPSGSGVACTLPLEYVTGTGDIWSPQTPAGSPPTCTWTKVGGSGGTGTVTDGAGTTTPNEIATTTTTAHQIQYPGPTMTASTLVFASTLGITTGGTVTTDTHTWAFNGQITANSLIALVGASILEARSAISCTGTCNAVLSAGNMVVITLTGNVTSLTFTNALHGQYTFIWLQGATPFTVSGLPSAWKGMTAPANTASTYARQVCSFDGTTGYCGALVQNAD